jgi:GNAT superfamily N-acetyltransferase
MLIVEEAKTEERKTALAITLDAYAQYEAAGGPEFWQRYSENIRRTILEDFSATILLAKEDGIVKGSVLFCPHVMGAETNHFPEMRLLAVPTQFRNRGLANLLIDECEKRAAQAGGLTLHTTELMQTAKAMYERRGYQRFPDIDFEPVPGVIVWGYKKTFDQYLCTNRGDTQYGYSSGTKQTTINQKN